MLANDIEYLHREYYPKQEQVGFEQIVFTTTNGQEAGDRYLICSYKEAYKKRNG